MSCRIGIRAVAVAVLLIASGLLAAGVAAVTVSAAIAPVQLRGGSLRISPDIPIVGARVTVELRLPGAASPERATLDLASPTGVHRRVTLRRTAAGLLRATLHFADDGLWTMRVRNDSADAYAEVLVLQNGAVVPAPKVLVVPGVSPGGGLGLLGGR